MSATALRAEGIGSLPRFGKECCGVEAIEDFAPDFTKNRSLRIIDELCLSFMFT